MFKSRRKFQRSKGNKTWQSLIQVHYQIHLFTQVLIVPGDLSSEGTCDEVVKKTVDHFGRLDVLVANAGIFKIGSLETTDTKTFDQVMNVNCRAVFMLMKFATPHLVESKGNIVAVSSLAGVRGVS